MLSTISSLIKYLKLKHFKLALWTKAGDKYIDEYTWKALN